MSLPPGTTLGSYEIREAIGQGGMGEVYRAKDQKLGREVAIKVLPELLRQDRERLARFQREARLLASLNHPGIATLHGLETEEDITYLVMELVPGETLQERIQRGPIALDEARELFRQIAEGLEAAHGAGVIHRDLKPANIKVTPNGRVKILDFGLAKAFADEEPVTDLSHSPTLTRDGTGAGVIMGTASYMSPEQAKGKLADKRADVWAFGCVLFEALTGRKAFDGESVTDVLANVIHKDPPWQALPEATPWRVRDVLRRCLTKDVQCRFHDVADVRIELTDESAPPSELPRPRSRGTLFVALASGALVGATIVAMVFRSEPAPPPEVQRFVLRPPATDPPIEVENPVISPNGRRIVYVGVRDNDRRLYLRELDELESREIEGSDDAMQPFFSPDSLWVGFFGGEKLKKVSVLGGAPIELSDGYGEGPGAAWAPDGSIWVGGNWISGQFKMPAEGGEPVPVTTPNPEEGEIGHWWPEFLPDGKTVLLTVFTDEGTAEVAALDSETGRLMHLFPGMQAKYLPSGHIVFYASGIYQAVPFDLARLEMTGPAVPVLEGTRGISPTGSAARYYDTSDVGTVVTVPGGAYVPRSVLAWIDLDGAVEVLPFDSAAIEGFELDPGGTRVALARHDGGIVDIWIYDLELETEERLTRESNNFDVHWTPDGTRIVFTTARRGQYDVFATSSDGLGPEAPILSRDGVDEGADALSPNGRWLAVAEYTIETGEDIRIVDLEGDSEPVAAAVTNVQDDSSAFSRDSAWIAFRSLISGRSEIYAQRVPDGTGRVRVSSGGGATPVWSPTKDELYYVSGDTLMAVRYSAVGGELRPDRPRVLLELPEGHDLERKLDVSPDGNRFLIAIETGEDPPPTEIHITTNWFEELRRLAPTQ